MNRKQYIEELWDRAEAARNIRDPRSGAIIADAINYIAGELKAMDVVWVPREPTDYMKDEGAGAMGIYPHPNDKAAHACYEAMLNAAENTNDRCSYCGGESGLHAIGCEWAAGQSVKRRENTND